MLPVELAAVACRVARPITIAGECSRAGLLLILLLTLFRVQSSCAADGAMRVIYPRPESRQDARTRYPIALLQLALDRSGQASQLIPSAAYMPQGRSLIELQSGRLDVVWTVTSPERERMLRPVRLPIDRGLIGWRLLLVRQDRSEEFSTVKTLAELARYRAGQGHDWPDVTVLRGNGLNVATSTRYEGLFEMLNRGHIDYFPRGLSEIHNELATHPNLALQIQPELVLHYPTALYFFVHPDNDRLAKQLSNGLQRALADGSWQQLFEQTYSETIAQAAIDQRHILSLRNPDLPAATPLDDKRLWWQPSDKSREQP